MNNQAHEYIKALTGDASVSVHAYWYPDRSGAPVGKAYGPLSEIMPQLQAANEAGSAVAITDQCFFSLERKTEKANFRSIVIDDDGCGLTVAWFAEHKFPTPNIAVRSANGCHFHYLIKASKADGSGIDTDTWRRYGNAIRARIEAEVKPTAPNKIEFMAATNGTRVPGFRHQKKDPFEVLLEHVDRSKVWTLRELIVGFGAIPQHKIERKPAENVELIPMSERETQARRFFAAVKPAIQGQKGRSTTVAAMRLLPGFALEESIAWDVACVWNQTCIPPWEDAEGKHGAEQLWPIFNDCVNNNPKEELGSRLQAVEIVAIKNGARTLDIESGKEEWADPLPLPIATPPAPKFDLLLLPAAVRPHVQDICEQMSIPADLPAVAVMVTLGAAIGNRAMIQPKPGDEKWQHPANLYGLIVDDPGRMKTPATSAAIAPYRKVAREIAEAAADVKRQYEALLAKSKSKKSELDPAKTAEELARLRLYSRKTIMVDDVTPEAMIDRFAANPHGFLQYRDEMTAMFAMFNREGREMERSTVLRAWNGTDEVSIIRRTAEDATAPTACLSIFGGIQPGVILEKLYEMQRTPSMDDGLLQRFQLSVWPGVIDYVHVSRPPTPDAFDKVMKLVKTLNATAPGTLLRFSDEAQDVFDTWLTDHMQRMRISEEHPIVRAHRDKGRKTLVQIAMILHLAEGGRGAVIGIEELTRAWAWMTFLDVHVERIYAGILRPLETAIEEIGRHIAAGELRDDFSERDVVRKNWRFVPEGIVYEAIRELQALSWIAVAPSPRNGNTTYKINPKTKKLGRN